MTVPELLARFEHHTRAGGQFMVKCPAHEDGTASLSIGEGDDGKILLKCHAGCSFETIVARLDLTTRDLFATRKGTSRTNATAAKKIVKTYDYRDASGALRYQVVRYSPKDFRQRRPDRKDWIWNLDGVARVLYRLPELQHQSTVVIVEGERDADRLGELGFVATTNAQGAGKWTPEYTEQLTCAGVQHVVIIPDNDAPGRQHAEFVATSCHGAGLRVQIVTLPGVAEKGDVSDYLDHHTRAELEALVLKAPVFPIAAVELGTILYRVRAFIQRYMILSADQTSAITLWCAHTFVILDAFDCTPYLAVTSPLKRSGKTRLFEIFEVLVSNPWLTGRVSAAVLVRKTDAEHPTLLLDESDAAFKMESEYAEALRGLLNTGYRRSGRSSLCVKQGATISYKDFSTFSAKAIAGIGKLPDTVADRSIPIVLKRRTAREPVERWRQRDAAAEAAELKAAIAVWAPTAIETLKAARPAIPDALGDRQADVWEPLLAIADLAGGDWPTMARKAAVTLAKKADTLDTDDLGMELLEDIRQIFKALKNPSALHSETLVEQLHAIEDRPWKTYGRAEKPITGAAVAKLLRTFDIPTRVDIRIGTVVRKGYRRAVFLDVWKRYLGRTKGQQGNKPNKSGPESPISEGQQTDPCCPSKTRVSPMNTGSCCPVAPETPDPTTAPDVEPWREI